MDMAVISHMDLVSIFLKLSKIVIRSKDSCSKTDIFCPCTIFISSYNIYIKAIQPYQKNQSK